VQNCSQHAAKDIFRSPTHENGHGAHLWSHPSFFSGPTLLNIFKDPLGPSLRLRGKCLIKGLGQALIKASALNFGFNKHRKTGSKGLYRIEGQSPRPLLAGQREDAGSNQEARVFD